MTKIPTVEAGTQLKPHASVRGTDQGGQGDGVKSISVSKEAIALPLAETGMAKSSGRGFLSHFSVSRLWWIPSTLSLLLIGAVAGIYFQPAFLATVFNTIGLKPGGGTSQPFAVPQSGNANDVTLAQPKILEVVALGRLSPEGGAMALAFPSGAGDARVARFLVSEGDRVEVGQVLAELDNLPGLVGLKVSAESALAAQQATLVQIRSSVQMSYLEARANGDRAVGVLTQANKELKRVNALAARGLATQVQLELVQSAATQAAAELDRTSAIRHHYKGAEDDSQPDIVVAVHNINIARASLFRASSDIDGARVLAPRAGTVLAIHSRPGEKPAVAGVLTLGNVDQMTAELEVYQTDIGKIALAQSAEIAAPSLRVPLLGKVTRINRLVERQSVVASDPQANVDARIVKVTVTLDATSSARARAYTNLEVIGRIMVDSP